MRIDNKKEFIKLLESVNYSYRTWEKFKDFCEITARTMQMAFYPEEKEKLLSVLKKYERKDIEIFDKMLNLIVESLTDGFCDFLGEVFTELGLSDKWKGQFFTPYHICVLMAEISLHDLEPEYIRERGFVSISDPTCGASAMPIAACEVLQEKGVNFQTEVFFEVQDVDYLACCMSYIQLSLCGAACRVVWGNSLSMKIFDAWYTPVFFLNDWSMRFGVRDFLKMVSAPLKPAPKNTHKKLPEPAKIQNEQPDPTGVHQLTFSF